jgi:hypothetical protein
MPKWRTVKNESDGTERKMRPSGERNARIDFEKWTIRPGDILSLQNLRDGVWVTIDQRGLKLA